MRDLHNILAQPNIDRRSHAKEAMQYDAQKKDGECYIKKWHLCEVGDNRCPNDRENNVDDRDA